MRSNGVVKVSVSDTGVGLNGVDPERLLVIAVCKDCDACWLQWQKVAIART
jgi:hypothetical protein